MTRLLAALPLCLLLFTACQMTGGTCSDMQAIIANIANNDSDIVRLTVHAPRPDGMIAIASTAAAKLGKASDPEDLRAVETGVTVVMDEGDAIDVTVPIRQQDGAYTAAVGVTLKGDDTAVATSKAHTIAANIDNLMRLNNL
jgi:hypothetical protein